MNKREEGNTKKKEKMKTDTECPCLTQPHHTTRRTGVVNGASARQLSSESGAAQRGGWRDAIPGTATDTLSRQAQRTRSSISAPAASAASAGPSPNCYALYLKSKTTKSKSERSGGRYVEREGERGRQRQETILIRQRHSLSRG